MSDRSYTLSGQTVETKHWRHHCVPYGTEPKVRDLSPEEMVGWYYCINKGHWFGPYTTEILAYMQAIRQVEG